MQVEAGVLHVDKGGVEPGEADDLDDLRVGDAADMGAEREPALAQDRFTRFSCIVSSPRSRRTLRVIAELFAPIYDTEQGRGT